MPSDPPPPYSIVSDSHRLDNQTDQWAIVNLRSLDPALLRTASLLLRFRGQTIEERGGPPMRRDVRGDEPDIVDGQPPVTDRRLTWCRVILEDESPVRKRPGI